MPKLEHNCRTTTHAHLMVDDDKGFSTSIIKVSLLDTCCNRRLTTHQYPRLWISILHADKFWKVVIIWNKKRRTIIVRRPSLQSVKKSRHSLQVHCSRLPIKLAIAHHLSIRATAATITTLFLFSYLIGMTRK